MPPDELHQLRGRDIAVIFQEPMTALNPIYTVGDQIVESLELHTPLRGAAAWNEAVAAMRASASTSRSAGRAATRTSSRAASASAR